MEAVKQGSATVGLKSKTHAVLVALKVNSRGKQVWFFLKKHMWYIKHNIHDLEVVFWNLENVPVGQEKNCCNHFWFVGARAEKVCSKYSIQLENTIINYCTSCLPSSRWGDKWDINYYKVWKHEMLHTRTLLE